RKAVALQSELVKKHPGVIAYEYSLSVMESSLARLLGERDKWKEARPLLEDSTKRLEAIWQNDQHRRNPMGLTYLRMTLNHSYQDLSEVLTHLGEEELAVSAKKKAETFSPGRPVGPRVSSQLRP